MVQDLYSKILILNDKYRNLESNYKTIIEENKNIKEENKKLKEENKNIKEEIKNIKEENNKIKEENNKIKGENINIKNRVKILEEWLKKRKKLLILKKEEENEIDMIKSAIEQTMNKEIKGINKLYKAKIDSGSPEDFIKNMIILKIHQYYIYRKESEDLEDLHLYVGR